MLDFMGSHPFVTCFIVACVCATAYEIVKLLAK